MDSGFVWQCNCGHIEHEDALPEDCSKCLSVGKFKRVPDDLIEEAQDEAAIMAMREDYDEEEEDDD